MKEESLRQMFTVQNRNNEIDRNFEIGLGFWLVDPMNTGVLNASHGGDLPPYHSVLITMPDSDLAVFAATNDHKQNGLVAINTALEIAEELMVWSGMDRPEAVDKGEFVSVSPATQDLFSGTYDTLAGVIEVEPKNDAFQLTLSGKKLFFAPRENGLYGLEIRLFNQFALPIPQLEILEIDMFEAHGDVWMSLWMEGIYLGAFSKLDEVDYPENYADFVGTYEIDLEKNILDDGSKAIDNVEISQKNGRYLLGLSMLGQNMEIALRPDGSYRALTDGTGRAMGDLLEFVDHNGDISLHWSGFQLSRNN